MQKKNLKSLNLNRKSISHFSSQTNVKGGISGGHRTCNPIAFTAQINCNYTRAIDCNRSYVNCILTDGCL
jgi:hypothetical protein